MAVIGQYLLLHNVSHNISTYNVWGIGSFVTCIENAFKQQYVLSLGFAVIKPFTQYLHNVHTMFLPIMSGV